MDAPFKIPQLYDSITETRSEEFTLLAEFDAATDWDLLALVRIEHVQLLPRGGLTENYLSIICAARRDHIIVGPRD